MLAGDLRRTQQALAAAERTATAREAQLAAAAGEAASLGRAHHEAQVEIQQLLQDLQVGHPGSWINCADPLQTFLP